MSYSPVCVCVCVFCAAYSTPTTSPAQRFVSVGPRDPGFNIPQQPQVSPAPGRVWDTWQIQKGPSRSERDGRTPSCGSAVGLEHLDVQLWLAGS